MSADYHEILQYLLCDLEDTLNEPHSSDWSKVFMVNHLVDRYKAYLEAPKLFEDAKRLVALAKGEVK